MIWNINKIENIHYYQYLHLIHQFISIKNIFNNVIIISNLFLYLFNSIFISKLKENLKDNKYKEYQIF